VAERRIETRIEILAPPARVWSVLTDFAEMTTWNPFITSISGDLRPGAPLQVHIAPPGQKGMRFKPRIVTVRSERELRWLGRLLLPGIFDGEHYFLGTNARQSHLLYTWRALLRAFSGACGRDAGEDGGWLPCNELRLKRKS
jgi:hypothetical protein